MIIFILKQFMNTKNLGSLKNYTWPLKSDKNLSNTKKKYLLLNAMLKALTLKRLTSKHSP